MLECNSELGSNYFSNWKQLSAGGYLQDLRPRDLRTFIAQHHCHLNHFFAAMGRNSLLLVRKNLERFRACGSHRFPNFGCLHCRKYKKEVKPCRKFKRILSTVSFCSTGHNPKERRTHDVCVANWGSRQKRKLLPFPKLQPPKKNRGFYI